MREKGNFCEIIHWLKNTLFWGAFQQSMETDRDRDNNRVLTRHTAAFPKPGDKHAKNPLKTAVFELVSPFPKTPNSMACVCMFVLRISVEGF
jgi:hypothetical protein